MRRFYRSRPESKREELRRLGMGVLDKVARPFLRVFWPKEPDFRGYVSESDATPLFAGEATSRDCAATVHGAYQSGLRAAGQTLKGYSSVSNRDGKSAHSAGGHFASGY